VASYRPQRIAAFRALWTAIVRGNRPGAPALGDRFRALPRMIGAALSGGYAQLGRGRLALLLLALLYLLSPVDLVPEAVLGLLGLADDAVVAMWLAGALLGETDRFLEWERHRPLVVPGGVTAPPPVPDR
jgi:uncharacterized membrane protein YkvA (DUF1232 family)